MTENIAFLSRYLSPSTIQSVLQHNYQLITDSNAIHFEIAKAKLGSLTEEEFKENLENQLVKNQNEVKEDNNQETSDISQELEELSYYAKTLPTTIFDAGEESLIGILYSTNSGNYDNPLAQTLKLKKKLNSINEYLSKRIDSSNQKQLEDLKSKLCMKK